jgi:hypothetical protein
MSTYRISVVDIMVHEWNDEEGQGDFVCSKGGFEIDTTGSIEQAKEGINNYFGYELEPDAYGEDGYISATQLEDEYGYKKPKTGKFICDYTLCIEKIDRVTFNNEENNEENDNE